MTTYQIKIDPELKALIPPLSQEELRQLEANIVEHGGARDPLVVWSPVGGGEAVLVDGHNRHEICTRLGLPYRVEEMRFESPCLARIWIRNNQQGRRNITPAWRIELELGNKADLLKLGRLKKVEAGKRGRAAQLGDVSQSDTSPEEQKTRKEIAKRAKTSVGQVAMAEVLKDKSPDLWEQCKSGDVGISTAYNQVLKQEKKVKRQQQIEEQRKAIEAGEVEMPKGVYEVVAMDPPWAYGREYDPDGSRVANPYPEMTQDQLLKMQPPFADDCVLFLWTTHQFLWDAGELMRAWGFTYKATLVWNKEKMGMGRWLRMQCEFCLIGIRGEPKWNNTSHRDIISESRREHSRKPEAFYEMVENVTAGRRLDYFSREQRQGWTSYGNDASKF